ncbi:MAG: hypothetical protein IPM51_12305 [Sphingobacteriaceae bacterium]|nr:hypothetical protein [Sphingobacteriaceae bacterium]
MVIKSPRKKVDSSRYLGFKEVAINFYEGGKIAAEYSYYNAAGLLIVHSAIAYSDAISIKQRGVKIQGENHYEIISLLDDLIAHTEEKKNALKHLKSIIDHKNKVSYSGDVYHKKDIDSLWKHFERFKVWCDKILK